MSLDSLLREVPKTAPMSAEQESTLAKRAQAGSPAAARAIAHANIRLVVLLVGRVRRPEWVNLDDLVQEGMLGLMHAIGRFDPALGRFRPYAARWVRDYAARYIARAVRRACSPLEAFPEPASGDDNPEEVLLVAEARGVTSRALSDAIGTLGPGEAAVMSGALAGLAHSEIGARQGCTRQNVQLIHKSARAKVAHVVRRDRRSRSLFGRAG